MRAVSFLLVCALGALPSLETAVMFSMRFTHLCLAFATAIAAPAQSPRPAHPPLQAAGQDTAKKTAAPAADEADVRKFIRQIDAALDIRDRSTLESIIAAGFAHLHSTGYLETRQSFIDRAVAGALMSQRVPAEVLEDELRIYDRRTALRTTRVRARVPQPGREPTEMNVRSIDVYIKMNGRWLWVSEQSTILPTRPKAVAVDQATLEPYVGEYEIDASRKLVVSRDGALLKAVAAGRQPAELIPQSPTEFVWFNPNVNVEARLTFVLDAANRVTTAVFREDGEELWRARKVR